MGGLTGAVHWWEEWQLRVFVLTSLAVQFLLLIFSLLRRVAIPGWLRFITWLTYLGGDAVAIYALATLFNRHKQAPGEDGGGGISRSSSLLEVFWAPILLLHLGGHDGITAYNIEDNELWSRHLLTAVSQVTVAIYVFYKTWPPGGDKRLLQATIVLFIPGVLKCFHKPWALKSASIYSLVSSPTAVEQEMYPLEDYVKGAKVLLVRARASATSITMEDEGRRPRRNNEEPAGTRTRTRRSVRRRRAEAGWWRRAMHEGRAERRAVAQRIREMYQGHNESSKLFVDLSSSYSRRLSILEDFCRLTETRAYASVRHGLATAFLLLYTKFKTVNWHDVDDDEVDTPVQSFFSLCIQASRSALPWAAIGLFQHSHREAYNDIDVKITYVLLCCTAAIEAYSIALFYLQLYITSMGMGEGEAGEQLPQMVSQYSFIGYFARNMKHSKIMWIVSLLGCKDFLDQKWCMDPCFWSDRITRLVLGYLKDGWKEKITNATSYRRFNNHRSSEGLSLLSTNREDRPVLFSFDESVLIWHIATDFCFFSTSMASSSSSSDLAEVPVLCRQMSNYMAYLLFVNPEMLLPGSRRNIFTLAHEDLEDIFEDDNQPLPLDNEKELTLKIIDKLDSSSQAGSGPPETTIIQEAESLLSRADSSPPETTIIQEARLLAQKLQNLGDEKKMWEVIQGVWVEMLCFSASRCRGYLHAKALGSGGEFLSYVSLLLFYMGMETFTDKLKRDDLPSHEAPRTGNNTTTAPPSTSKQVYTTGGTTASSSKAHADAAGASDSPSTSEIRMAEDDMV